MVNPTGIQGCFSVRNWFEDAVQRHGATPEEVQRYLRLFGEIVTKHSFAAVRKACASLGDERVERWLRRGPFDTGFIVNIMGKDPPENCDLGVLDQIVALGVLTTKVEAMTVHRSATQLRQPWAPPVPQATELLFTLLGRHSEPFNSPLRVISWLLDSGAGRWAVLGFSMDEYIHMVRCGYSPTAPRAAEKALASYLRRGYTREEALHAIELARLFSGEAPR